MASTKMRMGMLVFGSMVAYHALATSNTPAIDTETCSCYVCAKDCFIHDDLGNFYDTVHPAPNLRASAHYWHIVAATKLTTAPPHRRTAAPPHRRVVV